MCQVVEREWRRPVEGEKLHPNGTNHFSFNTKMKPKNVLCLGHWLDQTARISTSRATDIVNELSIVTLGFQGRVRRDNAANIFLQPPTNQRGGHCLLHTEITFPYQLSVEIKCLMFVCCRKVAAVNQVRSESCFNLFFINLLFEHTNNGTLTTGSTTWAHVAMQHFCTSSKPEWEGKQLHRL